MKKLWLAVALIAFLSVLIVIALVTNPRSPREPEYNGKKLTAWLDDLHNPSLSAATQANARLAIQEIGTNAVPFLVQMLYAKDSPLERKYMGLLGRQHWVDFHLHYDYGVRVQALQGLMILGPDAKAAIPSLVNLLSTDQFGGGTMAAFALVRIGPPSVPALENALTSSNESTRFEAAEALGNIAEPSSVSNLLLVLKDPNWLTRSGAAVALQRFPKQANVIVPALINCLDDPNDVFRGNVMRTLGSFGADARPAIPKLLIMAADTNRDVSVAATNALNNIDPEAEAKLNGK